MNENTAVLLVVALAYLAIFLHRRHGKKSAVAPLPPGPKGLPLLGNVMDLPESQPWVTFAKWGEIYGGILHVSAFGKTIIVLNDAQYAVDMLDKKGRLYSDRPTLIMGGQLVGWDASPAIISFSSTWSGYRRLMAKFMGTRARVEAHRGVLQDETNDLLTALLADPMKWAEHVRKFSGAIALMLAYGYKVSGDDDAMIKLVNVAVDQFSEVTTNNAFLVDIFPFLRHVPAWFPGAAWKRKIPIYRKTMQDMVDLPVAWVNRQIIAGIARPSFLSTATDGKEVPGNANVIKWAAAGIYSGGADTTVAGIDFFVLAMTLHSAEQQKSQAELDSVIGTDRLPTLADRARLPYFEALFSEILRTYPIVPLGVPHSLCEDDVHNGYLIPKGSAVVANSWQFCRDPKVYVNPDKFSPERFLASDGHVEEADPRQFVFGFGRRTCPGIHLADASMWLACVSIIAGFNISPPVQDGKPVYPSGKRMDGTISHPEPFECVIRPRSRAAEALVRTLHPTRV